MIPKYTFFRILWNQMTYQELRLKLQGFAVFNLSDIRRVDPGFYLARLNDWQAKKYIVKLRRGHYMFRDRPLSEETLFLIANRLYQPSYVSLESALSYYGLIPEGVYSVTSISTKKTARFIAPVAGFLYRNVKPSSFFGYALAKQNGQGYTIADMEKAFLDYVYLHPRIANKADFHEWRFNGEAFLAKADVAKLRRYAAAFGSKVLVVRVERLLRMMKRNP
ncbi:MAG: hypothetical protein RLZZ324_924 [Candidatus Parcubacteria bacterium]|jgi:predicted transcriptional regulator of viral defense system